MNGDSEVRSTAVDPLPTDYVQQPNLLSRSIYKLPVIVRQVLMVAWARVKIEDVQEMSVTITVADMLKALGKTDGSQNYYAIQTALDRTQEATFKIRNPENPKSFVNYNWVRRTAYDDDRKEITIIFDEDQRPFLQAFQNQLGYHKIQVSEFAKLEGRYSQRIYERAMSWRSEMGRGGNPAQEWWFDVGIPEELRDWLVIGPGEYKRTSNLRMRAIDDPVKEINAKITGLHIEPKFEYHNRRLKRVRFNCRMHIKRERNASPSTPTEIDEEKWIEKNPELWDELYQKALRENQELPGMFADYSAENRQWWREQTARGEALKTLKSHPDA
ncbi:replication initiation protein, partial [Alkalispirochaeta alkalica]|uniref:replication initiation protein n=1 Tax=Alkalispirochaeta alkalica TaxID=46356 RepID=UPI0014614524